MLRKTTEILIRINLIFNILIVLFYTSCSGDITYNNEVKDFDCLSVNQIELQGEKLNIDVPGADNIFVIDSLLVFISRNPSGCINVYSLNNTKHLEDFGSMGRARNEFMSMPYNTPKQLYYDKGKAILRLVDGNRLKNIDLTSSLKEHKTILTCSEDCLYVGDGEFVLLNNRTDKFEFRRGVSEKKEFGVPRFYILKGDKEKEIPIFRRLIEGEGDSRYLSMYCYCWPVKHPSKDLIIQPFLYLDYILLMDLNKNKYCFLHQSGTATFNEPISEPKIRFFDCFPTESFFLVAYNGKYNNKGESSLLLFDWDGNIKGNFILSDVRTNRIAFDSVNQYLYVLDRVSESIYRFNMNGLIPK